MVKTAFSKPCLPQCLLLLLLIPANNDYSSTGFSFCPISAGDKSSKAPGLAQSSKEECFAAHSISRSQPATCLLCHSNFLPATPEFLPKVSSPYSHQLPPPWSRSVTTSTWCYKGEELRELHLLMVAKLHP